MPARRQAHAPIHHRAIIAALSRLGPRGPRTMRPVVAPAAASLRGLPGAELFLAVRPRLLARLRLAEPLDQHAATLAVGEKARPLRPGRLVRDARRLFSLAAIVPPQGRVLRPPRMAAAGASGRLVAARLVTPAAPTVILAMVAPPAIIAPMIVPAAIVSAMVVPPTVISAIVVPSTIVAAMIVAARLPPVVTAWAAIAVGFGSRLALRLRRAREQRPGKVGLRLGDDPGAELVAQHSRAHLLDAALGKLCKLERTEGDADQPVHLQPEMAEHVPHLAVLALADRESEPHIRSLLAVERGLDRSVMDALDRDAVAQPVEIGLRHPAERAHAVAAPPAGLRQLQHAGEAAVVGEQQETLGVDVEPADRDKARQMLRQGVEDGRPPLRIGAGGHEAAWRVVEEEPGTLARGQWRAVHRDAIGGRDAAAGLPDHLAVDRNPAGRNPGLGLAARREARAGDRLGDALAALCPVLGPVSIVALAGHRLLVDKRRDSRVGRTEQHAAAVIHGRGVRGGARSPSRRRGAGRLHGGARPRRGSAGRQPHPARS